MFQNWIQRDIAGPMGTRSSIATQLILAQLVGNHEAVTKKNLYKVVHKIRGGRKLNDRWVKEN